MLEQVATSLPPSEAYRQQQADWRLPPVTLRASQTPVSVMLLEIAAQAGVSVVIPAGSDEVVMTVDLVETDARHAFEMIAAEMKLSPELDGNAVRFVKSDGSHTDFTVFGPQFTESKEFQGVLKSLLGEDANIATIGDRVVVTADGRTIRNAERMRDAVDVGPDGWMLDVRMVEVTKTLASAIGIDWDTAGGATIRVGGQAGDPGSNYTTGVAAGLAVSAIASATVEGTDAQLLHTATMYLLEGESSSLTKGQEVPIPQLTTSPEGTVTTAGYQYVQTGLEIIAKGRRVPGGLWLELEPTISSVAGYVDRAPILVESSATVTTIIRSGEWLILAGLDTADNTENRRGLPMWDGPLSKRQTINENESRFLLLLRATRIYAGS